MSLFAGIVSRNGKPVPETICTQLHACVSGEDTDERIVFRTDSVYLVKVDYGVFGEPAYCVDLRSSSVSMMAGEPLLSNGAASAQARDIDLQAIHRNLETGWTDVLQCATGIFALVHFSRRTNTLVLLTDKLGLRPVYVFVGNDYVVFATAMRILEQVKEVPKRMDVVGVTEVTGSPSYPSNDRTIYTDIKRLRPAEMMTVQGGTVRREYYWDWRTPVGEKPLDQKETLALTRELFMSAIRRRLRNDKLVPACLSGGLDSRCVVAGLRNVGATVHTFTFYSQPNSQERVLAEQFASAAGTYHTAMQLSFWQSGKSFEQRITGAWLAGLEKSGQTAAHPRVLWTGDGGSVTLGHLLAEKHIISEVRAREFRRALIKHRRGALVSSIVRPEVASAISELMVDDFRSQLEWADARDLASAYHLYLVRNHQRNDFTEHFEQLDRHRLEFRSPFYDSDFVAAVLRVRADERTGHKFYHEWMKFLPKVCDVPWQTYPGHESCPLPIPPEHLSQWHDQSEQQRRDILRPKLVKSAASMVMSSQFASPLLRRGHACAAVLLHGLHLRNCHSALNTLVAYQNCWEKSRRTYEIAATNHDYAAEEEKVSA